MLNLFNKKKREIKKNDTIALVDWYWVGHHPNYFANFLLAMTKNEVKVLPVCPEENNLAERLSTLLPEKDSYSLKQNIYSPILINEPLESELPFNVLRKTHNAWRRLIGLKKILRDGKEIMV